MDILGVAGTVGPRIEAPPLTRRQRHVGCAALVDVIVLDPIDVGAARCDQARL